MGDMLSQAELDALLGNMMDDDESDNNDDNISEVMEDIKSDTASGNRTDIITAEDQDVLGEVGNINMGTAATTLSTLLSQKVLITTPKVRVVDWATLSGGYDRPAVGIRVGYREGLRGSNILILKDRDVKIIADLMMGGAGVVPDSAELNDLDMSAIGEAMNQMVGSASTSLSSMIRKKIDIETPQPFMLDFSAEEPLTTVGFESDEVIVCISFRMEIGELIDSEIMQILPVDFAHEMVSTLKEHLMSDDVVAPPAPVQAAPHAAPVAAPPQAVAPPPVAAPPPAHPPTPQPTYGYPPAPAPPSFVPPPQNVQTAQFQPFDVGEVYQQKENMGIIMDVPLEITVELGRTHRKISEILEFSPGMVIELDKLAGEPIDILVNGKFVAKGEVVVIDENFGIRITDIISIEKRI